MIRVVLCVLCLLGSVSSGWAGRALNGSSQYLTFASALVASPFTVCVWGRSTSATAIQQLFHLPHTAADQGWYLRWRGDTTDIIEFTLNTTAPGIATTSTSYAVNTWHLTCGVDTSATSRAVYLGGGSKGTNATSLTGTPTSPTTIGRRADNQHYFAGDVGEVCLWSAALNDAEIAALGTGVPCTRVRPANLVACPRLLGQTSPERDECAARTWTLTGAPGVSTTHPPVSMRTRQ